MLTADTEMSGTRGKCYMDFYGVPLKYHLDLLHMLELDDNYTICNR